MHLGKSQQLCETFTASLCPGGNPMPYCTSFPASAVRAQATHVAWTSGLRRRGKPGSSMLQAASGGVMRSAEGTPWQHAQRTVHSLHR